MGCKEVSCYIDVQFKILMATRLLLLRCAIFKWFRLKEVSCCVEVQFLNNVGCNENFCYVGLQCLCLSFYFAVFTHCQLNGISFCVWCVMFKQCWLEGSFLLVLEHR